MNAALWLDNLLAYCLQTGVLVVVGALLPTALKLRRPEPMLRYWQGLLLASIMLPLLQPWQKLPLSDGYMTSIVPLWTFTTTEAATSPFPLSPTLPALLCVGVALRLVWLGVGLCKLRRYRQRARPPTPLGRSIENSLGSLKNDIEVRLSEDVRCPLTFGFLHPVVLLPTHVLRLPPEQQQAILCHELAHVRRKDWLVNLGEEVIRAFLWFHPAIYWLVKRIRQVREQVVDREVVAATGNRDSYLEALVATAQGARQDLIVLAPLFLSKRHLSERVAFLTKEEFMSKRKIAGSLVLSCLTALGSVALAVWSFPLQARPQAKEPHRLERREANSKVIKKVPPVYPAEAKEKGIQGTLTLEIRIDEKGGVSDARVVRGPHELRKSALQAVLQWKYSTDLPLPAILDVEVNYTLRK